jgi:penicillin-binding protein 1A
MTSSYAVFASGGYKTPAFGITRITNLRGDLVYQADPNAPRPRVLDDQIVREMNGMLRNVVEHGTGRRAIVDGVPAAGKTGTTSSYRDAWFCGFTGNYVAAVWMGNDDYHPTNRVTGGTLPATIWQKFMEYAHTNIEVLPAFGIDFTPRPFVTAEAAPGDETSAAERPPTLTPEAGRALNDIADQLARASAWAERGSDGAVQASLAPTTGGSIQVLN